MTFVNNTFINNLGYGAYVLHYTRSYYGSDSTIEGDVQFRGNTINKNTGYGAYIYFDAYKQYGVTTGTAKIISNATFLYNTMSGNSGAHGFYYFKYARCYYSSHSTLNGTVTAEGNTIEDNKGYGIYIYAYSYNYRGALGNTFITGDIWVRDNTIRRNGGGGIYLYCYSYSYDAKSADVYQNISFARNTVSNNGYHGFVVSVTGYSNRAVGGDTNVVGDISYIDNKVNSNQYTGIYFSRSAAADYTAGTGVYIIGDVRIEGNEANSNYNYGITVSNSVRNSQAGLSGRSELRSDYIVRNNTVKNNLYWIAMNLQRTVSAYYTGTAVLDSDMFLEDNVVQGNRGIGVRIVDNCDQYYYGGAGNPDRGSFTQKGQMDILRNSIDTNAGDGLNINATIDAAIRVIEPAPRIMDNSISYNGGNFGFYCDLRDITKPITITNNTIEHNEVQYVALISNSGTAPDLLFKDNRIRYNNVEHTILGLIVGDGDYNATFTKNNVSYNDADELVLAFVSKGLITVSENTFMGNTNATDVIVIRGQSNESVISVTSNIVVQNSGNGINVDTLGKLTVRNNEVRFNTGTGVIATTNVGLEVIEAVIDVIDNTITDNDGNGVWSVSMNSLSVTDNSILRNGFAGIRVNAMREKPVLTDNTITGNKWGLYLTGDNLAPLTTTYNFQDLTITGSTHEGLYAEDLTIQVRSCIITGSANADLAVRRARIDCYSTDVGYASGHVYESGHIKVWWRVDIDVEWQSGVTVPNAHVTMVADYDNRTYRELETDYDGHIATFNVEEWSMIDQAVYRWSPFRCTATKNTESSTQVETVDQSRTILIILRDVHVPSMVILEPLEDALLNYSIVRVSGTASDEGSGLSTVRVRLDDGLWDDLGKVKAFTKLLPVPDGKHVISVQGEDVAGVLATVSVNITIDTVLPRFMLVYPTEGLLTNTSLIEVEGRVLEPGLEVTVNDLPQKVGADNVFKDVIRLFEGPNVIKVWARDAAGNQRLLVVNLTLDTIAPMLSVDSPPDHHLTREPTLTLVGRSEPGADILVGPVTGEAGSGGAFSMAVELVEGANTLAVTARDAAGNSATVFIHVRLDTMPPFLTIEEPEDGLLTRDDKVRVVGAVEDEDGMVLSVGGSFALPSEGRYNHTVDLVEGKNLVVVTARDVAGNEAKVNITVTRRTNPPLLQVTRPSYDYLVTNEVQYRIEGVTDPDVVLTVGDTTIAVDPSGNFTREVQLKSGENVVSIVASDVLGNVASTVVHLILDTEPPTLVVDFPIDGYITEEIGLNVSGRTDVGSDLTINDEGVPTDDKGRFSVRYDLMLGRQNLTILAKDQAGNEAAVKLWVERTEPVEPSEPVEPPTLGGSTAAIIVAVLVGGIAAAVGYMYLQKRRQQAD